MYCSAYDCINNDGEGECTISSYIRIDDYGQCDEHEVFINEE